ncbi:toxin-antitoxin system, toxin component, PIN domain protein [Leptospira noguchii serovar Autumnalis str. ZUN142]|uniref:Toxin-antitoxin system, toxin component, PIN domain protein n=1 Tax=Leptospira noguchii serovar Autumnalis str. ZUN142 TaxID=1085540 RepID=M6UHM4_9LEPT|nr:toxin-antitoxin system, toxin component, PIN domain protein [Leptospira noguchii serovar Autumnalis str. ZUN142]
MLKVLLDTNIYISVILLKEKPRLVFQEILNEIESTSF